MDLLWLGSCMARMLDLLQEMCGGIVLAPERRRGRDVHHCFGLALQLEVGCVCHTKHHWKRGMAEHLEADRGSATIFAAMWCQSGREESPPGQIGLSDSHETLFEATSSQDVCVVAGRRAS